MTPTRDLIALTLTLILTASFSSCTAGSNHEVNANAERMKGEDADASNGGCLGAEFDAESAKPLDDVRFVLKESEARDLVARVFTSTTPRLLYAPVFDPEVGDPDTRQRLRVPFHPGGLGGGVVRVQFATAQGDVVCPASPLRIEEAPRADGESERLIEALRGFIDARVESFGYTPDAFLALYDLPAEQFRERVPEPLYPLLASRYLLDHPDNPFNLSRVLRGEDPMSVARGDSSEESRALVDAFIARSGVVRDVIESTRAIKARGERATFTAVSEGDPASVTPLSKKVAIPNAAALSDYMHSSLGACSVVNGSYGDIVTAAGLASAGDPVWKAGTASFALTGTVINEVYKHDCALYPGKLVNLAIDAPAFDLLEDEPQDDLYLRAAKVDAKSRGTWNPAGFLFAVGLQAKGSIGAVKGGFDSAILGSRLTNATSARMTPMVDDMVVDSIGNYRDLALGTSAAWTDELTKVGDVGPYHWYAIDVRSPRWLVMTGQNGNFRSHDCGANSFCLHANRVGDDRLIFQPSPDAFPTKTPYPEHLSSAVVWPMQILFSPRRQVVRPGQKVEVGYAVEDAIDEYLDWSNSVPGSEGPFDRLTGLPVTNERRGTMTWTTPEDRSEYPVFIKAESLSTTGLLRNRFHPRPTSYTFMTLGELDMSPRSECVKPGEELQFEAIYDEQAHHDPRIVWEATGGSIDREGAWRAPERRGVYEVAVKMTTSDGGEYEERTEVLVGNCECYISAQVIGPDGERRVTQEFGVELDRAANTVGLTFFEGSPTRGRGLLSFAIHRGEESLLEGESALTGSAHTVAYLEGFASSWFADPERALTSITPYTLEEEGASALRGRGISVHPYRQGDKTESFIVHYSFGVIMDEHACATEATHDAWKRAL